MSLAPQPHVDEQDCEAGLRRLQLQTGRSVRNLSTVAGLRALTELPANLLRHARQRLRGQRRPRASHTHHTGGHHG